MEWLVYGGMAAVAVWFFFHAGRFDFWKVAAKHPDDAYRYFKSEACWYVDEFPASVNPDDLVGPFSLWIPELGGQKIKVWGVSEEIEASQNKFMRDLGYSVPGK